MSLEFKQSEFLKLSFIFSVLLFLICLQTLTFQDVFSTNNKSFEYTNESSNSSLSNSSVKKKFVNINDGDNNNTSVNQNQQIINEQKIKIVAVGDFGCSSIAQNNIKQSQTYFWH